MHMFPQLRRIEHKYGDRVIVLGVHSPKFPAERETANLREAVLRYRIEHPVVNDRDFAVWNQFGGRAWPTLMFVDPQGRVIGKHEGELPFEQLDPLIGGMLKEFEARAILDPGAAPIAVEQLQEPARSLKFPGKVLATDDAIYVADTNHHRIVKAGLDGSIEKTYGSGDPGLLDGPAGQAAFQQPQGMAKSSTMLYVADTENHAIRSIDLESDAVTTLAGTGEHAQGAGAVAPFAGTAREGILDGPAAEAWFAQPSGLALAGGHLYVADSEVSAVRAIELRPGVVTTIAGEDLFVFGDQDGEGDAVRLQHPLGITARDGVLFVADSYNNKIKRVEPRRRVVTTWLGSGAAGYADGPGTSAAFREPGGVCAGANGLYIAATNNHRIAIADWATGTVRTLIAG